MWNSPVTKEMTLDDPSCFLFWEALNDPILTSFILRASDHNPDVLISGFESKNSSLKTINDVSAEIARNYIEYRGFQIRLNILDENIKIQREILTLNRELSIKGLYGAEKENDDKKNLESLLIQRPLILFSMEKIIFHLSTLLYYPVSVLNDTLCQSKNLPKFTESLPIGYPEDLICNNPSVKESRKQYRSNGTKLSFYNYQKTVLEALETAETALAAFNQENEKWQYLENAKNLRVQAYQLTKDLNHQGLKDDRDVLIAYQELISEENSVVQGHVDLLVSYINLYHAVSYCWEI